MDSQLPVQSFGLPQSLKYDLPPSISDDCRSYLVNIAPNGINSVTGASVAAPFTVDSGGNFGSFPQNIISFDLPSGNSDSVYIDTRETTISFRMTVSYGTSAAANAATTLNLISSASSFFDSVSTYSNNVPLEIIQNYNLLFSNMLNNSVNFAERQGGIAVMMGCNDDPKKPTGIDLIAGTYTTSVTHYYTFTVPLISILGLNNISDKLFPIGMVGNINLQLQTAANLPFSSYTTSALPTTVGSITPSLDNFSLNLKYVDIGASSQAILKQANLSNKIMIKCRTFTASSSSIPSGSSGNANLLFQIRNSSVNALLCQFSTASSLAICPNGLYDAINPLLISLNVSVGGIRTPQRPLNPSQNPSSAYAALCAAWQASSKLDSFGGVVSRSSYGASIGTRLAGNLMDSSAVVPALAKRATAFYGVSANDVIVSTYPNMAYYGFDLSKVPSSVLFSGVNTRNSPPFLECTFGSATNVSLTAYAWAMSDMVLVIDTNTKQIQAFI